MMKHFLPLLPPDSLGPTTLFPQQFSIITFLSARVGSISDNNLGGWYSYRASKAAQNQITKTMSLDLQLGGYKAIACGYHPGTVETALSGEMGRKRREAGARGVFTVEEAIQKMMMVMSQLKEEDSGTVKDWEGKQVPW
jgi:NAD(P)-dependent dehydrogenase (short-subunit alcohol dehydrogenase family)